MSRTKHLLNELERVVGTEHVLRGPAEVRRYVTDWTGRFVGTTPAVVLPATTAETAEVVRLLREAGVAFVPQGGNTGLVAGATPLGGEVILATARLDGVTYGEDGPSTLRTGAGVSLAAVQEAARAEALEFPVDFASRARATLGGMASTDAAGLRAFRHGRTADRVLGLEGVLGSGAVVRTGSLRLGRDRTPLGTLLLGSEGSLGVITRLSLSLEPPPAVRITALVGSPSIEDAVGLVVGLRDLPGLEVVELMGRAGIDLLATARREAPPLPSSWMLLLEVGTSPGESERAERALAGRIGERPLRLARESGERNGLWAWREGLSEAIQDAGVPRKLDVGLPLGAIPDFVAWLEEGLARCLPDARLVCFGHLGVGNLHLNLLGAEEEEWLDDWVLTEVARLGGDVAAEHGFGRAKAAFRELAGDPAERSAARAVKDALDPGGLVNPGVLGALRAGALGRA